MEAAGVGPSELARCVQTTRQDVHRWRDQERRLTPEWAALLAPHLETTAAALLLLPDESAPVRKSAELLEIQDLGAKLPAREIDEAIQVLLERRASLGQLEAVAAPLEKPKAKARLDRRKHS